MIKKLQPIWIITTVVLFAIFLIATYTPKAKHTYPTEKMKQGEYIGRITSVEYVEETEYGSAYTEITVDKAHFLIRGLTSVVIGDSVYLISRGVGQRSSIKMESFKKEVFIE